MRATDSSAMEEEPHASGIGSKIMGGSSGKKTTTNTTSVSDDSYYDQHFHQTNAMSLNASSAATSVTGSVVSEEEMTGGGGTNNGSPGATWLGGIGADFKSLAVSIKETTKGVASFVQRSAINVANEIALLEQEDEEHHHHHHHHGGGGGGRNNNVSSFSLDGDGDEPLRLPWELFNEDGEYEEDEELKERILDLTKPSSQSGSGFMAQFRTRRKKKQQQQQQQEDHGHDDGSDHEGGLEDDEDFVLDEGRVQIIRELLQIDKNLSGIHAKLSTRSDIRETTFWHQYFLACDQARQEYLRDLEEDETALEVVDSADESDNSLIPDDDDDVDAQEDEDDERSASASSYVCLTPSGSKGLLFPSPPRSTGLGSVKSTSMSSVKSTSMKSVDSMVIVETHSSSHHAHSTPTSKKKTASSSTTSLLGGMFGGSS